VASFLEWYMQRRKFITLLGGAAATWPLVARAQQAKVYRIGVLFLGNADAESFPDGTA
jgi:putative ABC transport system substrate-binding protein